MANGSTFAWQHALLLHSNKSPFDSPLPRTHQAFQDVAPVSWERKNLGGILVTVYGQRELPSSTSPVTCCWLLHGRGDTQDSMGFCASALLHAWWAKTSSPSASASSSPSDGETDKAKSKGLIVVTFDQRNHGSRLIENANNLSWSQGNASHAPDMFGCYVGTARDLSGLITLLPAYLPFPIARHVCGGVSLGGHATWVALMADPRVEAGFVVVGCPDYVRLMRNRAVGNGRVSATGTREGGKEGFVGSVDFPEALVRAVEEFDPAGILRGVPRGGHGDGDGEVDLDAARRKLERTLKGKRILCLSGEKDKLVPYAQGAPFLTWLKEGMADGWASGLGIELEDVVDPDAKHEFSALMRKEAERWMCELLSDETESTAKRESKI